MTATACLSPSLRAALSAATGRLDAAERGGQPSAITQALADLSHAYRAAGELAAARVMLLRALRWAATLGAADTRIDLLCDLADVLALAAEGCTDDDTPRARALREQARDQCFEASRLAGRSADPQWEVTVLLRVSDVLDRCGDHDDAIALQCRALELIARGSAADAGLQAQAPSGLM